MNAESGPSRHAARAAIAVMPAWFRDRVSSAGMRWCNWNSPDGGTAAEFAAALGVVASGVDEKSSDERFEVLFSTGVLERARPPCAEFEEIAARASRYVVMLLEDEGPVAPPGGRATSAMPQFPAMRGGFVLAHATRVDVHPCSHLFCIYAHPGEVEGILADMDKRGGGPSLAQAPGHALSRLYRDAADLQRIRSSRLWRWSAPMRSAIRVLTGKASAEQVVAQARSFASHMLMRLPIGTAAKRKLFFWSRGDAFAKADERRMDIPLALLRPAPARSGKHDVFVWAVIDWHFRIQRPQHLSRALAERGHRVFYITNDFIDSAQSGFGIEPLDAHARLFQVRLHVRGAPSIYAAMPTAIELQALEASLAAFMHWARPGASISLVQHPYWSGISRVPRSVHHVFDCMDHHAGFSNNAPEIVAAERELVRRADLVVVSSSWLEQQVRGDARRLALVRNAGDHAFFAKTPRLVFRDKERRKVIGYYGAIGPWFDVELVARVARAFPDALILLIGEDTAGVAQRLAGIHNVRFEGEVPYRGLPYWLHAFDVCLLPFRVNALTLATNPVKIYEYLSAGKQVVAVDLPEMAQFGGLVQTAADGDAFVMAVRNALTSPDGLPTRDAMLAFAARQTWDERAGALEAALAAIPAPD